MILFDCGLSLDRVAYKIFITITYLSQFRYNQLLMFYTRNMNFSRKLRSFHRNLGIIGSIKSTVQSVKSGYYPGRILIGPKTITNTKGGDINLENDGNFLFGCTAGGVSSPRLEPSKLSLQNNGTDQIEAENRARIGAGSTLHVCDGQFSMGDSYINARATIFCMDEISIGDDCAIAWNVHLLDADRHSIVRKNEKTERKKPISIKNNVWIGHDVSVKKGVTIGSGAVVASNSVVTKDVEQDCLVAGVPARPVEYNITWK